MADSFAASFAEARHMFLDASRAAGAIPYSYSRDDIAGRDGEVLSTDVAVLGDAAAPLAAVVITGTHGSEGYCGSAILHRWLVERAAAALPDGVKVVLVHAINPWAFSFKTRANENNVDINRNFLPGGLGYERKNPSYDAVVPYLHGGAARADDHLSAYKAYLACLDEGGAQIEAESLEGQSRWPDGLFYTGAQPEWSNTIFRRIVTDHLARATAIGFIDFHTGIGRYGEVVHLIFDDPESDAYAAAKRWWFLGKGSADVRGAGAVPRYEGLLCKSIRQELTQPKIAGAVIEFGTADDYSIFRADRLDRWLRHEGRNDPDHDRLREDYLNICSPRDIAWRRFVLAKGPELIDDMVSGLSDW